jgi:hypothetical protein
MKTKTISDYALLIGELIRRAELCKTRRQRWSILFQDQSVQRRVRVQRAQVKSPRVPTANFFYLKVTNK